MVAVQPISRDASAFAVSICGQGVIVAGKGERRHIDEPTGTRRSIRASAVDGRDPMAMLL